MIRGLIFDFDGLILETEGAVFQSYCELFEAHQCRLEQETFSVLIGTGTADAPFDPLDLLEKEIGRPIGDRERVASERRQREMDLILGLPVLPGVREILEGARQRGLRMAIASSSDRAWVEGHLGRFGLREYFETIKTCEDVALTKPDPALYSLAVESLGLQPEQAIAFEDSPHGVVAAKRAGLYCVAVPHKLTRGLPGIDQADLELNSLAEMPLEQLLDQFNHNGHLKG